MGFWIDEGLSVGISDRPLGEIPDALRLDGSPPLYYMLLHVWMARRGHLRGGGPLAVGRLHAARRARRVVGGGRAVGHARGLDGGRAGGHQPVPDPVRAGGPHVRAARPAGAGGLGGLRPRVRARAAAGGRSPTPWCWPRCSTRTTGRCSSAPPAASSGSTCCGAPDERRETLILGAIAFGGALALYLPWIPTTLYQAAHTGAPWSESPTVDRPARDARHDARAVRVGGAGAGRRRWAWPRCCGARTARPRRGCWPSRC